MVNVYKIFKSTLKDNCFMDKEAILESEAYQLGIKTGALAAFCEAALTEAKAMSFSSAYSPEEYEILSSEAEKYAEKYGVHLYLDKELLKTELFKKVKTTGKWVYIIYKDKLVLKKYLSLKAKKNRLVKTGKYSYNARMEIAKELGRLLGYSEKYINKKLNLD